MPETIEHSRLRRSFHGTFKPERHYINAILKFAASGSEGDIQEISTSTGIPTGKSTGKVLPTLDYCRGMGLLLLTKPDHPSAKRPSLTPFGRIVLLEDPFLKTGVTQWIAHLNLCGSVTGADVWYRTFFLGSQPLGRKFTRGQLEAYLSAVYGTENGGIVGPLIGMYEDDAAFRVCGALSDSSGQIVRKIAPLGDEFGRPYGAWLLKLIDDHFPNVGQISITNLDATAGWATIPGWDNSSRQRALGLIESKGLIEVDRHMEPWLIRPRAKSIESWTRIYDDLL